MADAADLKSAAPKGRRGSSPLPGTDCPPASEEFAVYMEQFQRARGRAQGLIEYGLIIALVAILAIAGLIIFGPAVSSLLSAMGGSV